MTRRDPKYHFFCYPKSRSQELPRIEAIDLCDPFFPLPSFCGPWSQDAGPWTICVKGQSRSRSRSASSIPFWYVLSRNATPLCSDVRFFHSGGIQQQWREPTQQLKNNRPLSFPRTTGFYLRLVLAFGHCRCLRLCVYVSVRVSVNTDLVCKRTHHTLKLAPPNVDIRCKTIWLRSLCFFMLFFFFLFFFFLKVKFNLKSQIYPILSFSMP